MTDVATFKAAQKELTALERAIDAIREERIVVAFTNPLAIEQRRLERQREAVEAKLKSLAQLGVTVLGARTIPDLTREPANTHLTRPS
jgi:hypothetical protein